ITNRLQNSQRGIEQQRWLLPLRSKLELGFTRSPLALLPGAGHGHSANRTSLDLVVDFAASVPATAGTHIANQLHLYMTMQRENTRLANSFDDLSRKHGEVVAASNLVQQKVENDLRSAQEIAAHRRYTWSTAAFVLGAVLMLCITWLLRR
ncbi:hypothetical protein HFK89_05155, partial [Ralstonia pseudosolanacearum]|uniref:hypothetical protein n=1 Tax=Ralstonia pseudosolanacearum TaxID=1310165 RepID=UPI002005F0C7